MLHLCNVIQKFLSTPSARRATRCGAACFHLPDMISIHALREEGDEIAFHTYRQYGISIHALREEGDIGHLILQTGFDDFYPRPPRGGRPWCSGSRRW